MAFIGCAPSCHVVLPFANAFRVLNSSILINDLQLRDGMRLVRTEHAHSQWTLTFISQVLLTEGTQMEGKLAGTEHLRELVNLPALAECGETRRFETNTSSQYDAAYVNVLSLIHHVVSYQVLF